MIQGSSFDSKKPIISPAVTKLNNSGNNIRTPPRVVAVPPTAGASPIRTPNTPPVARGAPSSPRGSKIVKPAQVTRGAPRGNARGLSSSQRVDAKPPIKDIPAPIRSSSDGKFGQRSSSPSRGRPVIRGRGGRATTGQPRPAPPSTSAALPVGCKFCTECGVARVPGSKFCGECGYRF